MKKGVYTGDNKFWDWFNQIKMNTIARVPVTISLLDESGIRLWFGRWQTHGLPRLLVLT